MTARTSADVDGASREGRTPLTPTVLVIGSAGTGKTHFITQLALRLNDGRGDVKMRDAAPDLSMIEEATIRLNRGLAAAHTPTGQYREMVLPLRDRRTGKTVDLDFPDYAGEQISHIVTAREISSEWRSRVQSAQTWLLFVRPQLMTLPDDILSRPIALDSATGANVIKPEAEENGAAADGEFGWSDQARLVELLQLLLAAVPVPTSRAIRHPRLTVLLSCWDEIAPPGTGAHGDESGKQSAPQSVLEQHAPLLASFITANWSPSAYEVFGVSSLGRPLHQDVADQDFVDRGPENFGYVVLRDGSVSQDLSLPIVEFLRRSPSP